MKKIRIILLSLLLFLLTFFISFDNSNSKYIYENDISEIEINIESKIGVYAKLYDTNFDDVGDKLVLGNNPDFIAEGVLLKDYDKKDNTELGNENVWLDDLKTIETVDIIEEIEPTITKKWFANAQKLKQIYNISNLNTSNVTNMSEMFKNCDSLKELDLSSFDTSNVTNMDRMFSNCGSLTQLDLSNFNTSKVANMYYMFSNCKNLTTIYVKEFNTTNVSNSFGMFSDCINLFGENGTKYIVDKRDKEYARIDTAETPGYFTLKLIYS